MTTNAIALRIIVINKWVWKKLDGCFFLPLFVEMSATTEHNRHIVERIRILRERKKISQEELALALGYSSREPWARVEQGKTALRVDVMIAAAEFLDVPLAAIMDPGQVSFEVRESGPTYVTLNDDSVRVRELEAENLQLYRRLSECQEKLLEHMTH